MERLYPKAQLRKAGGRPALPSAAPPAPMPEKLRSSPGGPHSPEGEIDPRLLDALRLRQRMHPEALRHTLHHQQAAILEQHAHLAPVARCRKSKGRPAPKLTEAIAESRSIEGSSSLCQPMPSPPL